MNLPADDLDRCADERLDGLIDDATWTALEERHGNALAIALHQARERRAAVAAMARPDLPSGLRERLLPPARAPLRFPWGVVMTAAIAACLVILVLPRMVVSDPLPSPSSQARQASDQKTISDPAALAKGERVDPAPVRAPAALRSPAATRAPLAPQMDDEKQVLAELAETARHHAVGGSDLAIPADGVPGPHAIALAWAPQRRVAVMAEDTVQPSGRAEPELRQRNQRLGDEALDLEGQPVPSAAFSAPVEADANQAGAAGLTATTETMAVAAPAATGPMVVVLHNRTVSPWAVAADQMRIEARDAAGNVIWEGRVDAIGTLTVAPGGFLSLTVDQADWPETTHALRAVLGDLVSADLSLEPRAPK